MKIKAENYPVILIAVFFAGMVLAMALGFRPEYGSHRDRLHESSRLEMILASQWDTETGTWL